MENQISQILEKLQTFSPHAWEAAVSYVRTSAIIGMIACLVVIAGSIYLVKWSAPKVNNSEENPLYICPRKGKLMNIPRVLGLTQSKTLPNQKFVLDKYRKDK